MSVIQRYWDVRYVYSPCLLRVDYFCLVNIPLLFSIPRHESNAEISQLRHQFLLNSKANFKLKMARFNNEEQNVLKAERAVLVLCKDKKFKFSKFNCLNVGHYPKKYLQLKNLFSSFWWCCLHSKIMSNFCKKLEHFVHIKIFLK